MNETTNQPEHDEFSVYQFFADGSYKAIKRFVSAKKAVQTAKSLTSNATNTKTARVIITDGGDCIAFEWIFGRGVTYPKL